MTRVLGIDPGATIGVAMLDVGSARASLVACAKWDDGNDESLVETALRAIVHGGPEIVAIERVSAVHGAARMGSSYAEGLARCNWIGGLLAGLAHARGKRVVTCSAAEWRSALCTSRVASDGEVKQMVRIRVPNWPAKSNEHERDAAGVALWAGLETWRRMMEPAAAGGGSK